MHNSLGQVEWITRVRLVQVGYQYALDMVCLDARRSPIIAWIVTIPFDFTFAIEDDGELYIIPHSSTSDDEGDPYHEESREICGEWLRKPGFQFITKGR